MERTDHRTVSDQPEWLNEIYYKKSFSGFKMFTQ